LGWGQKRGGKRNSTPTQKSNSGMPTRLRSQIPQRAKSKQWRGYVQVKQVVKKTKKSPPKTTIKRKSAIEERGERGNSGCVEGEGDTPKSRAWTTRGNEAQEKSKLPWHARK